MSRQRSGARKNDQEEEKEAISGANCEARTSIHMDYYECMQCKFFSTENFNYLDHSCFANIDVSKEDLYVNESNQLFKSIINTQMQEAEKNETYINCKEDSTSNVSDHVDDSHANDCLLDENTEDASCSTSSIFNDGTNSTSGDISDNGCRGTKRQRNLSTDGSFHKDLIKMLSDTNKPLDGIDGFLLQLGDILRRLPYKNRRIVQNKMMTDVLQAEEEAGLL